MPKNKIKKEKLDAEIFRSVRKERKVSIIKLAESNKICNERTIRQAIKDGEIQAKYLEQISRSLNVDPRLLTGELHKIANEQKDETLRALALKSLTLENYPYFNKRRIDLSKDADIVNPDYEKDIEIPLGKLIELNLSLFDISLHQFERMSFDEQYYFQHDLFESMADVMVKHFAINAYGKPLFPEAYHVVSDLENYYDDYNMGEAIRAEFLNNLPKGKTEDDIKKMKPHELVDFYMELQFENEIHVPSRLEMKYANIK